VSIGLKVWPGAMHAPADEIGSVEAVCRSCIRHRPDGQSSSGCREDPEQRVETGGTYRCHLATFVTCERGPASGAWEIRDVGTGKPLKHPERKSVADTRTRANDIAADKRGIGDHGEPWWIVVRGDSHRVKTNENWTDEQAGGAQRFRLVGALDNEVSARHDVSDV
jgi:hypothetical protein